MFLLSCTPQIVNLDSKGQDVICFGDSITSGEGVGIEDSYPSILSKLLKRLDTDVLSKNPYLVIIEFGGNDFLQRIPLKNSTRY